MSSISTRVAVLAISVALIAGFGLIGALRMREGAPAAEQNASVSATEPIPGRQIYNVTTGGDGPKIVEAAIDGLDASAGQEQKMRVWVQFAEPVGSVIITMSGDQGSSEHVLQLIEGSATDGRWEGSWIAVGTHRVTYQAVIEASAASASSKITLAFK